MKCPHCNTTAFLAEHKTGLQETGPFSVSAYLPWSILHARCPSCRDLIIFALGPEERVVWVHPTSRSRGAVPLEVPDHIRWDYLEAAEVLSVSPKASAALARRCLQAVMHNLGYKARSLDIEIAEFLAKDKGISVELEQLLDMVRKVGNFAAHAKTDWRTAEIIDVEPHEAELCLDILDGLFEHVYVKPARARKKKDELELKFGTKKPPS